MTPAQAAERLSGLPFLSFLDSASQPETLGRYSYIAAAPFGTFTVRDGRAWWQDEPLDQPPLAALRDVFARYPCHSLPDAPPFQGGAIGYIAYDFGRYFEGLPAPANPSSVSDDIALHFYDVIVAFDHHERRAWLIGSGWPEPSEDARSLRARNRLDLFQSRLCESVPVRSPPPLSPAPWTSNFTCETYKAAVARVRDYIAAGDIYQANISQRFSRALSADFDPWAFYTRLRAVNPAPFAAYLAFGRYSIASSSPERFLRLQDGRVEARPIKGTARRHPDPDEDAQAAHALRASEKDCAENVMIVDLMRNDLSRVCDPGSIRVPALCGLESYTSVHHLVSVVTGTLTAGKDALDLLEATFPGGSITGAPKIRAMEIITDIEKTARGVYCGAIGYIGFDGAMDMNIAIRTVVLGQDKAVFQTGGGITLPSDPEAEYEETLLKASRLFAAFEHDTPQPGEAS